MISKNILRLLSAALTALVMPTALSAQSAASTPAGCFPVLLQAGADNAIGIPLQRSAGFVGRIHSISGFEITLATSAGWTPNELIGANAKNEKYFCQIRTGALAGATLPIISNDDGSFMISPQSEDITELLSDAQDGTGDVILVIPYWTPESLFNYTQVPEKTKLILLESDSTDVCASLVYASGLWTDLHGNDASSSIIKRGEGLLVCLPANTADVHLNILGHVPTTPERFVFDAADDNQGKDVFFALSHPEGIALQDAGLELDDRTIIFAYDGASGYGGNPAAVYTFYEGYGWFDELFQAVDASIALDPGRAYFIRVPQAEPYTQWVWTRSPNYVSSI
jgi:hypothetical protein